MHYINNILDWILYNFKERIYGIDWDKTYNCMDSGKWGAPQTTLLPFRHLILSISKSSGSITHNTA